jgi:VanZ family protein
MMSLLILLFVLLAALAWLALGFWLTRPVPTAWRWTIRLVLAGVLVALLMPASAVGQVLNLLQSVFAPVAEVSEAAGADWVVHFLLFALLSTLLFAHRRDLSPLALGLGLVVFGAITEGLQLLVDGRHGSLDDVLANSLGVLAGALLALGLGMGRPNRRSDAWKRT